MTFPVPLQSALGSPSKAQAPQDTRRAAVEEEERNSRVEASRAMKAEAEKLYRVAAPGRLLP
jgi:hypothetical protein